MISEYEKKLANKLIKSHDGECYEFLKSVILPSPTEQSEDAITEAMYNEMCGDIKRELGVVSQIKLIDSLDRKDSQLSLWKVSYSASEYDIFWGISFDRTTHKVIDIHIDW